MKGTNNDAVVSRVRSFNRFYTKQIGVLTEGLLESAFSLTEVRILFEIAHSDLVTATKLTDSLQLDPGYVSRILKRLERMELLGRRPAPHDGRQRLLHLTPKGLSVFEELDARSSAEVAELLSGVTTSDRTRLFQAMSTIEEILSPDEDPAPPYLLRSHRAGDIGYVAHRHGELFTHEHGFPPAFEIEIVQSLERFAGDFDGEREHLWIAERDGVRVGSAAIFAERGVAHLGALLVEPRERRRGIGRALVEEAIRFVRRAGYGRLVARSYSVLDRANRMFERAGFRLTGSESVRSAGDRIGVRTWELAVGR